MQKYRVDTLYTCRIREIGLRIVEIGVSNFNGTIISPV